MRKWQQTTTGSCTPLCNKSSVFWTWTQREGIYLVFKSTSTWIKFSVANAASFRRIVSFHRRSVLLHKMVLKTKPGQEKERTNTEKMLELVCHPSRWRERETSPQWAGLNCSAAQCWPTLPGHSTCPHHHVGQGFSITGLRTTDWPGRHTLKLSSL